MGTLGLLQVLTRSVGSESRPTLFALCRTNYWNPSSESRQLLLGGGGGKKENKMKRYTKVSVSFEGIVQNNTSEDGIRVSIRIPGTRKSWWAVVPEFVAEEIQFVTEGESSP
jgi:hypothetical protein